MRPRGGDAASFGGSQSDCQAEEEGLWLATLEPPNCLLPSDPSVLPVQGEC